MSEYIRIDSQPTDDPDVLRLLTNLRLSEAQEIYPDRAAGDEGSPIAQALFQAAPGLRALTLHGQALLLTREADAVWETLIDDVRDALRDFFL